MTPDVTVRSARADDNDRLTEVDAASSDPGTYVMTPSGGPFLSDNTRPEDVLVAEIDGRVVGYTKIRPPTSLPSNAHVQQIQGLGVDPAARRRGVARALLDAAVTEARRRGARKLSLRVLSSNPGAQALYAASGYEVEGVLREEFRLDDGRYVDDVVMSRTL